MQMYINQQKEETTDPFWQNTKRVHKETRAIIMRERYVDRWRECVFVTSAVRSLTISHSSLVSSNCLLQTPPS